MTIGEQIERVLSRPAAKPYRSRNVRDEQIHLNDKGQLDFGPDDIENPKNWSEGRRWWITVAAVLLTVRKSRSIFKRTFLTFNTNIVVR